MSVSSCRFPLIFFTLIFFMMASPMRLYSGAVASLSEYCPTVPPLLHQHLFLQVCFVILQFLCYTRFLQLICYACPSLFRWGVFCFGASFPNPSAVLIIEVVLQPFSVPFPRSFLFAVASTHVPLFLPFLLFLLLPLSTLSITSGAQACCSCFALGTLVRSLVSVHQQEAWYASPVLFPNGEKV